MDSENDNYEPPKKTTRARAWLSQARHDAASFVDSTRRSRAGQAVGRARDNAMGTAHEAFADLRAEISRPPGEVIEQMRSSADEAVTHLREAFAMLRAEAGKIRDIPQQVLTEVAHNGPVGLKDAAEKQLLFNSLPADMRAFIDRIAHDIAPQDTARGYTVIIRRLIPNFQPATIEEVSDQKTVALTTADLQQAYPCPFLIENELRGIPVPRDTAGRYDAQQDLRAAQQVVNAMREGLYYSEQATPPLTPEHAYRINQEVSRIALNMMSIATDTNQFIRRDKYQQAVSASVRPLADLLITIARYAPLSGETALTMPVVEAQQAIELVQKGANEGRLKLNADLYFPRALQAFLKRYPFPTNA
ncbi:MAG: hypothetical protein WC775_05515 [Patescibacteria group bacterium]|jgi:hypothetical protein